MSNAIIDESTLSALGDATRRLVEDDVKRTPSQMASSLSEMMVQSETGYKSNVSWRLKSRLRDLSVNRLAVVDVASQSDMDSMFYYCWYLSSLSLPEGFGQNATDMHSMFMWCTSLSSLSLPEGFGQNANALSSCFSHCSSLVSVDFPAGFGQKATDTQHLFNECQSIKSISLPEGFGQSTYSMQQMFCNCQSLSSLELPETFGEAAQSTRVMFAKCRSLSSINLPAGFGSGLGNGFAQDTSDMFRECTSLSSMSLPANFKRLPNAGGMFFNCSSLVSVDFPEGFGTKIANARQFLYGCKSLSAITGSLELAISFDLKDCPLTHDSLLNVLSSIQTVTTKPTLTLGASNLGKLTNEEKAIATSKGWTLA